MPEMQFDDIEQQSDAAHFGIWVFLATEILFFGGLFLVYGVYRATYPEEFAQAGKALSLTIGTINTAILLTSSFSMAMGVHFAKLGQMKKTVRCLIITWMLGAAFLLLKAKEYSEDFAKGLLPHSDTLTSNVARIFYCIYYTMTGLHAVHMLVGLGIIAVIARNTARGRYNLEDHNSIEIAGLYWHFVDVIWIFLYPLLYLMDRSK
jgi:cytochrome c oxidase subunit 3